MIHQNKRSNVMARPVLNQAGGMNLSYKIQEVKLK